MQIICFLLCRDGCGISALQIFFGGVQGNIFGRISFELWAPHVPLMIRENFGEVPGPRRPTVSEPRPAQKLGVK